ncbi:MAG: hypothetical protein HRT99_02895 [Mycoplasmatales bacterium]|nr:hypothetical protein [Mycoplasmatales bacterium]
MNKWQIENIPYKERKDFVLKICLMYAKMIKQKEYMKRFDLKIKWGDIGGISLFENILELLTRDECMIIKKDFIKNDEYSNWYLDYWSKTTYYKYKNEAMNKLIYLLFY